MYKVIAHIVNRPNGAYRFSTEVPTFVLDETYQGIVSAEHAARVAHKMLSELVRQDLSAGAYIKLEVANDDGSDYACI